MKNSLLFLFFISLGNISFANNGDTIHIVTHNKTHIQTNPGIGHTEYAAWTVFPSDSTTYRKAKITMTFACPSVGKCGEWDYLNYIWLRRKGSVNSTPLNYQLVKFITPYGLGYSSSWKFTWDMDITDFSQLLHDSVEIEYQHTGYEATANRGWLVTLDFELTEGRPLFIPIKVDTLWHGSYNFGNAGHDLETYLAPRTVNIAAGSDAQRFFLIQTGHGSDTIDGCCEFANYREDFLVDNTNLASQQVWRRCGDNPNFPQNGTWPLDRGNWCPGSPVAPFKKDMKLSSGNHSLDLEMEAKSHDLFQQGNYDLAAYLFQYKDNRLDYDAAIENVLQPNNKDEFKRINGISANPVVVLKNNGKQTLTNVIFKYGLTGDYETHYKWTGSLLSGATIEVKLPNLTISDITVANEFYVYTYAPNNHCDEYPLDDTLRTGIIRPPLYDNTIVLAYKTPNNVPAFNATSADFSYQVKDAVGTVVYEKMAGSMNPSTVYRDTITLGDGVYDLYFKNGNADISYGLGFWFMVNYYGQQAGYLTLTKLNGNLIQNYGYDWGSFVHQSFVMGTPTYTPQTITSTCWATGVDDLKRKDIGLLNVYPVPTQNRLAIDISLPFSGDIQLTVIDMLGQIVLEKSLSDFHLSTQTELSVGSLTSGMYQLKVTYGSSTLAKKIVVE